MRAAWPTHIRLKGGVCWRGAHSLRRPTMQGDAGYFNLAYTHRRRIGVEDRGLTRLAGYELSHLHTQQAISSRP